MARRVTDAPRPYGVAVGVDQQPSRAAVWAARLLALLAAGLAVVAVALPVLSGYGYLDELTSTPEVAVAISFSATGALLVGNAQAERGDATAVATRLTEVDGRLACDGT